MPTFLHLVDPRAPMVDGRVAVFNSGRKHEGSPCHVLNSLSCQPSKYSKLPRAMIRFATVEIVHLALQKNSTFMSDFFAIQ
jgi:hypothetical protein